MSQVSQHRSSSNEGISFSESAKAHLLSYLSSQKGSQGIRLSVKKTGCSGYSYVVDVAFEAHEGDLCFPLLDSYKAFVDRSSYPYLRGVVVDYVKQGLNAKFVFNNPNQSGECGCGESFTISDDN